MGRDARRPRVRGTALLNSVRTCWYMVRKSAKLFHSKFSRFPLPSTTEHFHLLSPPALRHQFQEVRHLNNEHIAARSRSLSPDTTGSDLAAAHSNIYPVVRLVCRD